MDLKESDLFDKCKKCEGKGKEPTSERENSIHVSSSPSPPSPPSYSNDCQECGGTGIILTDLGKIFKTFFEKLK